MIDELRDRLSAIEDAIDARTYQRGRWTAWLRVARAAPARVRRALADDASRVSSTLHHAQYRHRCPLAIALGLEVAATVAAGGLLWLGRGSGSNPAAIAALAVAITTFEPLVKIAAGVVLGVRYEDAYLRGVEPRFKMRYGSYLAAPRPARILLGLAGCLGSPLAAFVVARLARPRLPMTATLATALMWIIAAANAGFFLAALVGIQRIGRFRLATSSGGTAGAELREMLSPRS